MALTESLPETVIFGVTESPGEGTDAHYVRGLTVKSVEEAKPGIMLTKRVAGTEGSYPQTYQEGDTVTYEFVVTNTGSTTLNYVTVTDQNISDQITGGKTTLAPQETVTFTAEHVLTKEDVASGLFKNVAKATGTDEGGNTVEDTDDETITTIPSVDPLGEPQHTKRIGKNDDGTYTLALDVTGKTQTSGGVSTTPVDVVMIIDRSSSMNEDITTTSEVTYTKVSKVVESDGRIYTDTYWDFNYPFKHEYQRAEQTSRPTDTYYVNFDGQYVEVKEETDTVYGERGTSYQKHVSWTANGVVVDPSVTPFYTRRTTSSSMTRMQAVKEAAKGFVNSAAASAGASAMRIGVIQYGSNSDSVIGLTNVATGADDINNEIDGIYAPGSSEGTQPVAAFGDARDMLSGSMANKVVIFFTDGGPGGTTGSPFNNNTANNTVKASKALKDSGVTVWSVGVFDGADPAASIDNTSNNSNNSKKMNAYMHATSSNYPQATGFSDNGRGQGSNAGYYQAASTSEQLNEIFQDIFHDSTKTQAYGNVSIVDELSQYAQVADSVKWDASQSAHTANGYPVTDGVKLEVKDASGNPVNSNDANYPDNVAFYYEPAASGATDTTGTVKAVFEASYQLQDGWTYTLKFDVKPTAAAYQEYAANGYGSTVGADGTNLYTDKETTPDGGIMNTSAGEPGFHSNKHAYVQYTADGERQTADYDHPVLQVELTPAGVDADAFVQVRKVLAGRDWEPDDSFTFTLTGVDNAPMPCEQPGEGNTCAVTINFLTGNNHQTPFDDVTYTKPGTYTYTVSENPLAADEPSDLDYSKAEYQVTVTVSLDQSTPGKLNADVEVAMTKNDAGENLNEPSVQEEPVAVFRNALNTHTYGDDATVKLGLRKVLEGKQLEKDEFTFVLQDVTDYNAADAPAKPIQDSATNQALPEDGVFTTNTANGEIQFGSVLFTAPGVYTVKVSESEGDEAGIVYDKHALYVRYTLAKDPADGVLKMMNREYYVSQDGSEPDSDTVWTTDWGEKVPTSDQLVSDLTWTNHYIAVSSLPLTGGRSTARTLLLTGGGVLLVAGAAWLLARRRRV